MPYHLLLPIQKEMSDTELILESALRSDISFISNSAQYVIRDAGKRIRPAVFILASKLLGSIDNRAISLAAGIELIHTASLLHDDVIDNASVRRNKPSANMRWGNQLSVILGDFLWCRALSLFVGNGSKNFYDAAVKTVSKITEGQILEITRLKDTNIDKEGYLAVIEGKTASLFGFCGEGAAIEQGLSERFVNALKGFGISIGMAYQLIDDVFDYSSVECDLGKPTGVDLCQGKLTMPVILAVERCNDREKLVIHECLISGAVSVDHFCEVLDIVNRYNGIIDTRVLALTYINKAKESLEIFKSSIEKETLFNLSDYILSRKE